MRVLMISKACLVGIYQRKLEAIARHGVTLLTLVPPAWRDERGVMPLERAYTDGYQLETLPIVRNGDYHLHAYRGLGARMRRFQPDIVHIDEEPYNLATWQALWHARRLRARTLFFTWQNLDRRYPPPFRWGERWTLRAVDHAIAGTASAAQVWRAKGFAGPLTVIPQFGTDPDLFHPLGERPSARPFTVGYVGRPGEENGIHLLLDAVARLDGAGRLSILGGGPLRAELEARAARLGIAAHVTFSDQIPSTQMPAHYQRLDALALPSLTRPNWQEQFGRVLVEAMASGVAVVGSSSGAIPDVIGDAGLVVPEGQVDTLAAALRRLQTDTDLRARLAAAGRERALTHFTHEQVAAATVRVYESLLAVSR
ncbi:MAG: glycosyltransferase family 4 protein [Chloroflexi bacterium]|nr:glycosyltransferase family 4 protein [Chloroflexota bacterium]